ncbi:hypothetical protein CEUSTIGMA_g968.t1 [Chlamydomonas eustigma]|uniref:Uncharacterized protein n=1 Tax=Chlamydomonas eustigma TaxID=1157962 RepID=A0A250WS36_9CHLO|nr:hypothetical protein CEUSTIGMA_g968.t1 [Chlamydomonas eustigma]|eukprot:GAX73516.1 hypothetical protein CEUSTIGMA_g968.t1 [Chlamydomonas eustigma]
MGSSCCKRASEDCVDPWKIGPTYELVSNNSTQDIVSESPIDCMREALFSAIAAGDEDSVRWYLSSGADKDGVISSITGRTPLHRCVDAGQIKCLSVLLNSGANVHATDADDQTTLHLATSNGFLDCVIMLLRFGAHLNAVDAFGRTPLVWTAIHGYYDILALLISKGAVVNTSEPNGNTPLHHAAYNGHEECVKLLLEQDAATDVTDVYGRTPLTWAAIMGRPACCRLLRDKGARDDIKDSAGYCAVDYEGNSQLSREVHCLLRIPLDNEVSVNKSHHSFELGVEAVRTVVLQGVMVDDPCNLSSPLRGVMSLLYTDQMEGSAASHHAPVVPLTLPAASAHTYLSDRPSGGGLRYRSSLLFDEKDRMSNASRHAQHHVAFSSVVQYAPPAEDGDDDDGFSLTAKDATMRMLEGTLEAKHEFVPIAVDKFLRKSISFNSSA